MSLRKLRLCITVLSSAVLLLMADSVSAEWALNMPKGVTLLSQEVYGLHMTILWIVTIIGIGVFSIMAWSIVHHRKSKGAVPAKFHHNTLIEIVWTIVPIMILVGIAVPATKTLILMEETGDAEMTVKITGYQWKWRYDYMDEGFGFFSALDKKSEEIRQPGSGLDPNEHEHYLLDVDNPIVIPASTKVRILTTAADVIHSWWVPELGWKRDAIPGFINDNWVQVDQPGVYRGQCTELCGKDHGFMPIVLKVVPKDEYRQWVDEMKAAHDQKQADSDRAFTKDELLSRGKGVYEKSCAACHQAGGQGVPGVFPAITASKVATGPVAGHLDRVLNGKAGTAMVAFGAQLSDAEIAAVVTFQRNALGNSVGDVVQPADVKAAR